MSVTKQPSQSSKSCAAKGCSNPGTHEMEILFLGRKGWFCEQCKDSLMHDGLLIQQTTATENCDSSSQGVNNTGKINRSKMGRGVQVTSRQTQAQPKLQDMQTHNNSVTTRKLLYHDY